MIRNFKTQIAVVAIASSLLVAGLGGCNKDEKTVVPPPPGNEFLTTVFLKCTNEANASDVVSGTWRDLTPDDLNPPDTSQAFLNLKKNSVYDVEITILDETGSAADTISNDIKERQNYHLFCFEISGGTLNSNMSIERTDHDTNNPPLPVGLEDKITTMNVDSGVLKVQLKHQPNLKDGTCDPGSVDLDVNFQITITN